jgi:hypothetical protein
MALRVVSGDLAARPAFTASTLFLRKTSTPQSSGRKSRQLVSTVEQRNTDGYSRQPQHCIYS